MDTWLSRPRMLLLAAAATLATGLGAESANAGILLGANLLPLLSGQAG